MIIFVVIFAITSNLKNANNNQINKSEENSLDRDSNISKEKINVDEGAAVANVETKD